MRAIIKAAIIIYGVVSFFATFVLLHELHNVREEMDAMRGDPNRACNTVVVCDSAADAFDLWLDIRRQAGRQDY